MFSKKSEKIPIKVKDKNYSIEAIKERQDWIKSTKNIDLCPIDKIDLDPIIYKKNVENLIGSINIPLGIVVDEAGEVVKKIKKMPKEGVEPSQP